MTTARAKPACIRAQNGRFSRGAQTGLEVNIARLHGGVEGRPRGAPTRGCDHEALAGEALHLRVVRSCPAAPAMVARPISLEAQRRRDGETA
jgi:hypothetical protein